MKEFRKNENGLFMCEECNNLFVKKDKLSYHINKKHSSTKEYYDKWLKEEGEGLCKICKKETKFTGLKYYYDNCCCKECSKKYKNEQTKISNMINYGVSHTSKLLRVRKKQKNTWAQKSIEDRHKIRKKIENTWINNYGVSNNMNLDTVKEKIKKTCLKKYGVENPSQNDEIKSNKKNTLQTTLLDKYGVKNVSQIPEFFEKSQKKQLKLTRFRNTDIWYQGSYELDFLEKYFDKYTDIKRGPTIKYEFEQKIHYYHSDFYIPSLNLVIEIKNKKLYIRDILKIRQKEIFTKKKGYNYLIIIDKNYTNINL